MQKINLLYVVTKLELGGAQKQLLSLIENLDRERFRPFLFTAQDGLLLSDALSIKCLTLKKSRYLERAINPFNDFLALIELYRFIKKNSIEIVHTHSSKAGIFGRLAARLAKVKVIIHTVHGWSFNDYQPMLAKKFFIWLERFTAQFTDKLIVVSNYDKQKGLDCHIGCADKYALIHYGIDYREFSGGDQNIREELGIDGHDLVIGMVACFKPQKSPQDFVKLANLVNQIMPNIKFILVGDGVLRPYIQRLINTFKLRKQIILTGWRRDIWRILSAIDIFVLTSLWEGLPIAALEAMASSKPIVATHTGGIEEVVIEGKSGFLVAPRDINKISQRISVLLKDETLRTKMGQSAKECLGFNFALANMLKENNSLYEKMITKKGGICAN